MKTNLELAENNNSHPLSEKIIKGGSIILLLSILTSPLGFFIRILYSHTLSIEMYGLFYALLAFFSLFTTFSDLGFSYSVTFYIPKYFKKKDYAKCWNLFRYNQIIILLTSISVLLILFLSSNWLAKHYFKVDHARILIRIFCIYYIAGCFVSTIEKFFIGLQQEKYYASIEFIRLFFTLAFSLLFWTLKLSDVYHYAYAWAIGYIITAVFYNFILYWKNQFLVKQFYFDPKLFKQMLYFAIPTLLTTSITVITSSTDVFFLTLFKGIKEVGIYNIVLPLVAISSFLLSPFKIFFLPLVSHLMEDNKNKIQKIIEMILKFIPFITFYFVLFTITFPAISIELLFGKKWIVNVELPLIILSIGYIFANLTTYLINIAAGMGYVKERLTISIILAILNLIISFVLIKNFGIVGAVISNSLIYIVSVSLYTKLINTTLPLRIPAFFYLKLVIFGGVFYSLVHILKLSPVNWLEFLIY